MEHRDRRDAEQQQHWGRTSAATVSGSNSSTGAEHEDSDNGSGDERRAASYYDEHWGTALRHLHVEPQSHHRHHYRHQEEQELYSSNQDHHSSHDSGTQLQHRDPYSGDGVPIRAFALTHEHAAAGRHQYELEDEAQEQVAASRDAETAPGVSKSSLSFILDDGDDNDSTNFSQSSAPSSVVSDSDYEASPFALDPDDASARESRRSRSATAAHAHARIRPETTAAAAAKGTARRSNQGNPKRKARRPPSRICKFDGCEQYVVDQGLCVRHGGGKRCQTEGCTSRAKHQGRCWRHGGSTECKIPSCMNRAKSRGYCWSHGGGTKCKAATCEKIAISNQLCWAHGGGKRCIVKGCMRQAYERTNNFCNNHFQELETGTFTGEIEDEDASADAAMMARPREGGADAEQKGGER